MKRLTPVAEALKRILASVAAPVAPETLRLAEAAGRMLAADLAATRTQPPFPVSAMDGYAVRFADCGRLPVTLPVVATSAAGHGFHGPLQPGEAARIFTGARLPSGADTVVIQENAEALASTVTIREGVTFGRHIRLAGIDFREGDVLLRAGQRLDPRRLALAAAMGHAALPVRRRPRIAILATGDELVSPGQPVGPDQIVASNGYAVAALVAGAGGEAIDLGIAADDLGALADAFARAEAAGADALVTVGGASVGDHDLVQQALGRAGMELDFWQIAMRPGKPLMHGRMGGTNVLGLPGNPVSAIVCAILFLVPLVRALAGDQDAAGDPTSTARLGAEMPANDARQDYVRASVASRDGESPVVVPLTGQDSSRLAVLAAAGALIVRPPLAPAARAGDPCRVILLDRF